MKEIGGYFGLEEFKNKEFYSNYLAFNSARNALLFVLQKRNIKKLYIPYFLCDSVSGLCDKYKYDYEYYHIDMNFHPKFDKMLGEGEYIYIVNYYGQINNRTLSKIQKKYKNIIFDNVQAFFQKSVKKIDTIYSCRKFFGVSDGAYLSTTLRIENEDISLDVSKDRMVHLFGRYEDCASRYYEEFKKNEQRLENTELRLMSKLTRNLLGGVDYKNVRKKREKNFAYLHKKLSAINSLQILNPRGPYAYPFYCKNGMNIKKKLAKMNIYIPTLWPNVMNVENSIEKNFAENILPLPCDQRYDIDDMKNLVKILSRCL